MITYKFFAKLTASKLPLLQASAMNPAIKSNIVAQEIMRRIKNASTDMKATERDNIHDIYSQ